MTIKYFAESYKYIIDNEEEKEDAIFYLKLWKKNLLSKLERDSFHCKIIEEIWGEKEAYLDGPLCQKNTIYLKLALEAIWDYEI